MTIDRERYFRTEIKFLEKNRNTKLFRKKEFYDFLIKNGHKRPRDIVRKLKEMGYDIREETIILYRGKKKCEK